MNARATRKVDLEALLFGDLDLRPEPPASLYDLMMEIVRSARIPRRTIAEELSRLRRTA